MRDKKKRKEGRDGCYGYFKNRPHPLIVSLGPGQNCSSKPCHIFILSFPAWQMLLNRSNIESIKHRGQERPPKRDLRLSPMAMLQKSLLFMAKCFMAKPISAAKSFQCYFETYLTQLLYPAVTRLHLEKDGSLLNLNLFASCCPRKFILSLSPVNFCKAALRQSLL